MRVDVKKNPAREALRALANDLAALDALAAGTGSLSSQEQTAALRLLARAAAALVRRCNQVVEAGAPA